MNFYEALYGELNHFDSIYDLVAYCYDYLINLLADKQSVFISAYIWENDKSEENNPNLESLHFMVQGIKDLLLKHVREGDLFEDYCGELCDFIKKYETELLPFGEHEALNHAAVPFFVIKGMELYAEDMKCISAHKRAPLNEYYQKNCYVYLNEPCKWMSDIAENADYGLTIAANEIRNEIKGFIFLEKREIGNTYGVPNMSTLSKEETFLNGLLAGRVIKIAVIPFSRAKMLEFPTKRGAAFVVEYNAWYRKEAKTRALKLLEAAIDYGANIIIFPEYMCSPDIQEAIAQTLRSINEASPERLTNLLVVVAGSAWTQDFNNVSQIYSYSGVLLGKQYKYSAFSKEKNMMEGLTDPGKATTMIKIPKIGLLQTGICRDISEAAFARQLARIFSPAFLLIPAWSTSINRGFKMQLQSIISENHTTNAVLCNCCEAFSGKSFRKEIGMIVTPHKKLTVVAGKEKAICRDAAICDNCLESGCIFLCQLDFSSENNSAVSVEETQIFLK